MVGVNWNTIDSALQYYATDCGYTEIDVPWHVRTEISNITCPSPDRAYPFEAGVLVGSAEQSFIQMAYDGELKQDKSYVAVTPCFRNESVLDRYHQKYFMKVELFHFGKTVKITEFAANAKEFFGFFTDKAIESTLSEDGIDLEIEGIEIGSYNHRNWNGIYWTCGTGVAEPRFSKVIYS